MYLKSIVLFTIGAAAHTGWKIPAGQPAGVYKVKNRADGTFEHPLLQTPRYYLPECPYGQQRQIRTQLDPRPADGHRHLCRLLTPKP
jgi:hypothetical protein